MEAIAIRLEDNTASSKKLLGARTLLGAQGIATRSREAFLGLTTGSKKLLGTRASLSARRAAVDGQS